MYKSINAASNALDNSSVFEMFDFDEIHYDCVVGYMWMNGKTPHEAAVHFGVMWGRYGTCCSGELMSKKLYADRDTIGQGQVYVDHVLAMTRESLHDKSDIAAELAERDIEIATLKHRIAQFQVIANSSYGSSTGCRGALQALLNMDVNGHALQDRLQFSDKGRAVLEQARHALGVAL